MHYTDITNGGELASKTNEMDIQQAREGNRYE